MAQQINQAVNQVRLTNVAVVRLKKNGKRFEIACYKNKVDNWRSRLETDIEEVLQIDRVFENVSKGIVAKKKDLVDAFGTDNQEVVCKIILDKGSSQVSDRERAMKYENAFRNVATCVAEKCVNPDTMRPYPVSTIENAMKNTIHFAVIPKRSTKQQALEVIKLLEQHMPLKRAQMLIRISCQPHQITDLQNKLTESEATIVQSDQTSFTGLVDPGHFRILSNYVSSLAPPGLVEVKDFSVQEDNEADVESSTPAATSLPKKTQATNKEAASSEAEDQTEIVAEEREPVKEQQPEISLENVKTTFDAYEMQAKQTEKLKKQKKKSKRQQKRENKKDEPQPGNTDETEAEAEVEAAAVAPPKPPTETKPAVDIKDLEGLKCLSCGVSFGNDRTLQREHYRTDLHRLNLKLKMKNLPFMTEEEFMLLSQEERDNILHDYR